MRQVIRYAQLEQLSPMAKNVLLDWEVSKGYTAEHLLAPTIGHLVEFLSERIPLVSHFELLREKKFNGEWGINCTDLHRFGITCPELIDALWTEVWAILDNDHQE